MAKISFAPLNLHPIPSPESRFNLNHPTLGSLTGVIRSPTVVQFRAIPYARIPGRFRQSVPIETLELQERDCTEYGPACPQNPQSRDAFGGELEGEKTVWHDEMECLNLTVSVPKQLLEEGGLEKVPVMVHVHGGAFVEGSHTQGLRDTARIVELSVKEGKPVIVVSIHYRVNFQGFLACQDLVDEARARGESAGNFGLYDQRLAFQWVQKHVSGFGGNGQDVTAFGESAGALSLAYHMCSTVPLFQRVVLQSGSASLLTPSTLEDQEELYLKLLGFCDIDARDKERLEKLKNVPVEKLIAGIREIGVSIFTPWADSAFFPVVPTFFNEAALFDKCEWVREIVIGDSLYEGYFFADTLRHVDPERVVSHMEGTLGAPLAERVLAASGITRTMDKNLFWTRITTFFGDIVFSAPAHNLVTSLASLPGGKRKKLYRYNNALRNPFPGTALYNVAGHHFVELGYQFMTLLERYPRPELQEISIEFARSLINFANGKAPWREFDEKEQSIAVVSSSQGWRTYTRKEDEEVGPLAEEGGRRYVVWEALNEISWKGGNVVHKELSLNSIMASWVKGDA